MREIRYRILDTDSGRYIREGFDFKEFSTRIEAMAYITSKGMSLDKYEVVGCVNYERRNAENE